MEAKIVDAYQVQVMLKNSEALRALEGEEIGTRILGEAKVNLKTSHRFPKWDTKGEKTFEQYKKEYDESMKQPQTATIYGNGDIDIEIPQAALMFNFKRYHMRANLGNVIPLGTTDFTESFRKAFPKASVVVEVDYSC